MRSGTGDRAPELTIIIPAFNEEGSILEAVHEIRKHNPQAMILAVDDGSTDSTSEILSGMGGKGEDPLFRVISHAKNEGYGAALKQGFSHATTPYVGFMDADLTYDPRQFARLLERMKEARLDCAWSDRFGGALNEMPTVRKVGNRVLTALFFLTTGKDVKDCTSGQRVFRTEALQLIDYESLPDGPGFISALTRRSVSRGLGYAILPTDYRKRHGISKQRIIMGFVRIIVGLTKR